MRVVRQQLKEQERQADDERYIKNKTQDENEQINKTNSLLQQQIDELSLQLIKVSVTPIPKTQPGKTQSEEVLDIRSNNNSK